jgi:hypothetical protein
LSINRLEIWELRKNLRVNGVAVHVNSTTNGGEDGEAADVSELGVVLHRETASNGRKLGEGDVGRLLAADNGQSATDIGEVGSLDALEEVAVETEGVVHGRERRNADGGSVGNVDLVGPDKVRKNNRDVATVGVDVEVVGDIAELHGDVVEVVVVLDVDGLGHLEVDALERRQLGVDDADAVGPLDGVGERQALETGETLPLNLTNFVQLGEVQGGKNLVLLEVEGSLNSGEAIGGDRSELGDVAGDKVAGDDPDSIEHNVIGGAGSDGDASREGGACCEARGVTSVLDGGGCGTAGRLGFAGVSVCDFALCTRIFSYQRHVQRRWPLRARSTSETSLDYLTWITDGWMVSLGSVRGLESSSARDDRGKPSASTLLFLWRRSCFGAVSRDVIAVKTAVVLVDGSRKRWRWWLRRTLVLIKLL